jgi:glutathione S-transferase
MTVPSLILHHYDTSPFSEKVRLIFGHKGLRWASVEQPSIMPKPDLIPLTGGYRRIPVLQIGADVYCDTQAIVREIERRHPTPTLYPDGQAGTAQAWNLWADRLAFMPAVAAVFAEIGQYVPQAFIDDRSQMMPGRRFEDLPQQAPHAREQLRALIATLDQQLAGGRPYLLGDSFSLADAACYHPLWFLRAAPGALALLSEFGHVTAWQARVAAIGHGERLAMTPAEALHVAATSAPAAALPSDPHEPNGIAPGDAVAIVADDYGFDRITGHVVHCTADSIALRRVGPGGHEVVVHFPRFGFRVEPPA